MGQQIRVLRSRDLEYVEKTTNTTNKLWLEQRVVTILFIRMEQVIHSKYFLLNRLYASGITEPNISLTTFVDLKFVICFSWWTDPKQFTVFIASLFKDVHSLLQHPAQYIRKGQQKTFQVKLKYFSKLTAEITQIFLILPETIKNGVCISLQPIGCLLVSGYLVIKHMLYLLQHFHFWYYLSETNGLDGLEDGDRLPRPRSFYLLPASSIQNIPELSFCQLSPNAGVLYRKTTVFLGS